MGCQAVQPLEKTKCQHMPKQEGRTWAFLSQTTSIVELFTMKDIQVYKETFLIIINTPINSRKILGFKIKTQQKPTKKPPNMKTKLTATKLPPNVSL